MVEKTAAALENFFPVKAGGFPGRLTEINVAKGTTLREAIEVANAARGPKEQIDLPEPGRGDKFELRWGTTLVDQTKMDLLDKPVSAYDQIIMTKFVRGNGR